MADSAMGGMGGPMGGMGGMMGGGGEKKPKMSASKKHPISVDDPTMTPSSFGQGIMKMAGSGPSMGMGGSK